MSELSFRKIELSDKFQSASFLQNRVFAGANILLGIILSGEMFIRLRFAFLRNFTL